VGAWPGMTCGTTEGGPRRQQSTRAAGARGGGAQRSGGAEVGEWGKGGW
jgi:hypothetical protein